MTAPLSRITRLATKKGHPCPFCDSSDAFTVRDDGESGLYKCFSCGARGDGVGLLVAAYGYEYAEALSAFGIERGDGSRDTIKHGVQVRRKEARHIEASEREKSTQRLVEWCRLRPYMSEREFALSMAYGSLPCRPSLLDIELAERLVERHLGRVFARIRSEMEDMDEADAHYEEGPAITEAALELQVHDDTL